MFQRHVTISKWLPVSRKDSYSRAEYTGTDQVTSYFLVAVTSWTQPRRSVFRTTAPSATSSSRFWGSPWPAATCSTPTWKTCNRCPDLRFTSRWEAYRTFCILEKRANPSECGVHVFALFFQITLSYGMFENKSNIINLKGAFPVKEDPSRWGAVLLNYKTY